MTADYRPEDHYCESVGRVYEAADVGRDPLSTDVIFDIAAECGVSDGSLVLDIGCANGFNTRRLQARTGCTIEGVDLVEPLVRMGRADTEAAGLEDKVNIRQGTILDIPFPDDHFDFVFCRDMLSVNEDLPKAVSECERVLKPGKFMLVYVTLATELLSADEADEFRQHLGCFSLDRDVMEACLSDAFAVEKRIVLGSQGVQQRVESGDDEAIRNLVKVARLETWRDEYVAEFGQRSYEIALADLKWQPYMLLGKLQGLIYVLRKES